MLILGSSLIHDWGVELTADAGFGTEQATAKQREAAYSKCTLTRNYGGFDRVKSQGPPAVRFANRSSEQGPRPLARHYGWG